MQLKAFITAGGKSTRFMEDKSLYEYNGKPLIQTVYDTIKSVIDDVSIIANDDDKYSFLNTQVFPDIIPDIGPIGGLYTALSNAENNHIFLFPCDMPSINADLIKYMSELPDYYDAIVPEVSGKFEPLHAIYSPSCLPHIKAMIDNENYKIINFYDKIDLRTVTEGEIMYYDEDSIKLFKNVNYKQDIN